MAEVDCGSCWRSVASSKEPAKQAQFCVMLGCADPSAADYGYGQAPGPQSIGPSFTSDYGGGFQTFYYETTPQVVATEKPKPKPTIDYAKWILLGGGLLAVVIILKPAGRGRR